MAISVGSVEIDVLPNARGIYQRLRSELVPAAARAGQDAGDAAGRSFGPAMQGQVGDIGLRIGEQIGQQIANRITASLRNAIRDGINQGGQTGRPAAVRQGDETAGAFSRALKTRLEAAFRSLPKLEVDANTSEADAEIQELRARMERLAGKRIGIDIDAGAARAEIKLIEADLTRLGAKHPNVQVRADTASALTQLAGVRAAIAAVDEKKRFKFDVDTSQALPAIIQLGVALGAVAAIPAIPVLAAGIGAIASAAVAASVGVGALAAVAIPAFMGIARTAQAQKAAQDAAATASIKGGQAASQGAARARQLEGAQQGLAAAHRNTARQIQQAEQAVADAKRSAAEANRQAAQQVRQAEQDVATAVQQAADRQRAAAQQVKDAKQALANAMQQAADRQQAANDRVVQAERSLADAQRTARQAQQDLTQARRDAAMELEDLANRLVDAQLSQRDAALNVQEAEQRLRAVRAKGSKASALEQAQAQLAYDQAVQRLKEQQLATKRIADEKKKADRAGVDGSDRVKNAQDRVRQAQRQVREQTAALAKAQQEAARQQRENALEIAAAQSKIADAQRNVARAQKDSADAIAAAQVKVIEAQRNARRVQEDGARSVGRAQESLAHTHVTAADSIASAQRQVASASQQTAGSMSQAAVAQAKYQDELGKLTPSARATFDAFTQLRSAFSAWSESLQPRVMPIFTRALIGLRNALPGLTPFAKEAADAVGELQDRASRGIKSKGWKEFKSDLAGAVKPAIIGLGVAFANLFKGLGGVVQAFLPHMDSIAGHMQRITGRFAAWGTNLKGSPAFERFLAYAAENGPLVARTIGDISSAFYQVGRALEPLSGPILQIIGALARGLASIAETLPWLIQGMYLAYIATRLWTLAMILFNAVMDANPITLIIIGIVALVAAVVYAYKHFGWFRGAVQAAWHGIQTAAQAAWTVVLKPVFEAIVVAVRAVGRWATWLWRNAIKPAFEGISLAARILIAVIATVLIAPLVIAFRLVAATGKWLYERVLAPAFRGIGIAAGALYRNAIKPAGEGIVTAFKFIGRIGKWLYENALRPAFRGIAAVAGWLNRNAIKPVGEGIAATFRFVARTGKWLWQNALAPAFRGIGAVGRWLYDKAIKPAFNGIASVASWLWRKGLKPAFDRIKDAVRLVGVAFGRAKDAIATAWGKVKSITKGPVNFVIKYVYGKGIRPVWNAVAKIVSLDELPAAPKLLAAGGTVGNGFGPARPMVTNRPTAIVGEGNPRFPEFVIPTDPRYRNRARALHAAAATKLMADGGVLGGAWDWTKDTLGKAIDWAKTGWNLLTNPSKAWDRLIKPIKDRVAKGLTGDGLWAQAIRKIPGKLFGGLKNMLVDAVNSMLGGGADGALGGAWSKPVDARFGTRFGVRGSMWSSGRHTGLDFPAAIGTAVKAVADGTISQTANGGPYGKHIMINHGSGLQSLYAHLSAILMKRGRGVAGGTEIGRVGDTGNTSGPHLHLEARVNGRAVDPMPFLTGAGKGFPANAVGAAQKYAKSILPRYSWGQNQFGPLKKLWHGESGWRWNARNPSSGAYGIPQALPASKMRSAGPDWRTNAKTQIRWGLGYIKHRPDYGSPARAYAKWLARSPHWYDEGGYLQPGLNLAYNGTGRPEPVFTMQQATALARMATDGGGLGDLNVQVFVGDREITDIARAEVRRSNGELVTALRGGRG